MSTRKQQEIRELATYMQGLADGMSSQSPRTVPVEAREFAFPSEMPYHKVLRAAHWLNKLAQSPMCGHGIIGCNGGDGCTSDHK